MPAPVFRAGATALITGGASGVGLAVAQLCRRHGMKLALVDNNSEHLAAAKAAFDADGNTGKIQTETFALDVGRLEQWDGLKEKVHGAFGGVDLLMLNAGMGVKHSFEDPAVAHKILDTNLFGIIHGITTFLPALRATTTPTALILTGSKQGITNPPGNPYYNASKAAVKSLAEQLSFDLRGTSTAVHLLVPGWTFTGLTGGGPRAPAESKPPGAWTPAQVAALLEARMAEGQFWAVCPDNDVTADADRRRMLWTAGDAVFGRPPLSRWRDEFADESKAVMAGMALGDKQT